MNLGDLGVKLAELGIDYKRVVSMKLDVIRRGEPFSPIVMVVETYALNENGGRYISSITKEAAVEIHRFFIWDLHLSKEAE